MRIPSPMGQIGGLYVDPIARVTVELYDMRPGIIEIRTTVEEAGKEPVAHSTSLDAELLFGHFEPIMDSIKDKLRYYAEDYNNLKPRPKKADSPPLAGSDT